MMQGECHRAEGQENTKNKEKDNRKEGGVVVVVVDAGEDDGRGGKEEREEQKKGGIWKRVGGHESPVSLQERWKLDL